VSAAPDADCGLMWGTLLGRRPDPGLLGWPPATNLWPPQARGPMGSLVKKRRKKMSKHKYRKRLRANRHKRKK